MGVSNFEVKRNPRKALPETNKSLGQKIDPNRRRSPNRQCSSAEMPDVRQRILRLCNDRKDSLSVLGERLPFLGEPDPAPRPFDQPDVHPPLQLLKML
jgi:hypothetical protein